MNKYTKIITVALVLILSLFIISIFNNNKDTNTIDESDSYLFNGNKNIECLYYNTTDFINIKKYELKKDIGTIHGCIVPHHLLAKDLVHEVFQNVCKNKYKTVVLIGPDHESIDKGKIFTTLSDWQTPMGILETDKAIINYLIENNIITENDDKLTKEHSTSGIIPFIKYYLGDVKVITLVLTKQTKIDDIDKLVKELYQNINIGETLFIASVDFSHYLDLDTANKMDLESMDAIKYKKVDKIMNFKNDNLDSPISIVTILKIMDKIGSKNSTVLNHSNSELIIKKKLEETTSYITYLFY
ncbi:AmmeMemoRadiSam system protein B [Sedimentibacter acidaminivorans]|uniref:AmmeMemoRadiSam system protein B n=1 Tax=Sedimentibacter acidaminivorans TaxID=913099 RepID=A0ABS4GI46_9FIRM|nr:AmmeMemoRadiSam system protein B [Sedimentibacter acidaminivorans]MBP1927368.1 AmmeMemoRadiSam system protein B [Sedimentibacter acidaminivorans]